MKNSIYSNLVRKLFELLNDQNIYYVIPRNYYNYPYDVGKDLDILVEYSDLSDMLNVLTFLSWKMGVRYSSKRKKYNEFSVTFCFGELEKKLDIDIHHCISLEFSDSKRRFKGTSYRVFPRDISRHLVTINSLPLYVPTEYNEIVLTLQQWLCKRKPEYLVKIISMMEKVKASGSEQFTFVPTIQTALDNYLDNGKIDTVYTACKDASIELWGNDNFLRIIRNNITCVKIIILQKLTLPPIIYFSGPDGSGKTTTMYALLKHFDSNSIRYVNLYDLKFILRRFTQRISKSTTPTADTSIKKINADEINAEEIIVKSEPRNRDDGSAFWKWKRLVALLIGLIDIVLGYAFTLTHRSRGRVVVIETSPYDIFIKYHMPRFHFAEKYLSYIVPKPSVGFLLVASPTAIRSRKPELTIAEIRDYYLRINMIVLSKVDRHYVRIETENRIQDSISSMIKNLKDVEFYEYE